MLTLFNTFLFAQTSVDPLPNYLSPNHTRKFYSPQHTKRAKFKKTKVTHTAKYEFYKRIEKAAKNKQRILRRLSKPQFSNPAYFGHKHIPKRRPPHRMRFCSECQIRH